MVIQPLSMTSDKSGFFFGSQDRLSDGEHRTFPLHSAHKADERATASYTATNSRDGVCSSQSIS